MTTHPHSWEKPLIALAQEAWYSLTHPQVGDGILQQVGEKTRLDRAYAACTAMTAEHSRSFYLASALLPAPKRRAARALYAFCRVTDDLVDRQTEADEADMLRALRDWQRRALDDHPDPDDPVALAWADTRHRFRIPRRYAEQLIEGVARDLTQRRYQSFADLTTYCYGVASTVGLMTMHIIGFAGPAAIPYAVKLGVALQLTNILRDIAADFAHGRVYLPLEELYDFGIRPGDLAEGRVTPRWRAFMRFQIDRNRQLYDEAWPGIGLLHPDGRLAIAAAATFYRHILDDIEAHDYDVFSRRAHVTTWGKWRRLPAIWLATRRLGTIAHR
ncbi:MAG: phytoene/squalene synthase family protein [Caldilineales bacterium]|nr:phytoene/squalene synthase family protein [Caldilineales bacterium]